VLAGSWHALGARQAIRRLVAAAESRTKTSVYLPESLLQETFELAVGEVLIDPQPALDCLHAVRQARASLELGESVRLPPPRFPDEDDARFFTAAVRVAIGELAESAARVLACEHTSPRRVCGDLSPAFSRICFDSYAASLWTSVHADFILSAKEVLGTMPPGTKVVDVAIPPGPTSVAWAVTSLPDTVHLVDRRGTSAAARVNVPKAVTVMHSLLNRCTSSSSRGWETATTAEGKDGEAALRICAAACVAALTGMNQVIHPAARPSWEERMRIQRTITFSANEPRKMMALCGAGSREAMRLYLATVLSASPCVREALLKAGHPSGGLIVSPFEACSTSLQACAATLASIGKLSITVPEITPVMNSAFSDEQRKWPKRSDILIPVVVAPTQARVQNPAPPPTAVSAVSTFVTDVFSAQFVPFWTSQYEAKVRVARLSQVQHAFFHKQNPIHALFDLLPAERQLFVQRVALTDPRASCATLSDVAVKLGHPAEKTLAACSATAAAEIVLFARVAAIKSDCRAWDLGARIKGLQTRALAKRLVSNILPGDDVDSAAARIPTTASHLCVCVECRRVCNSINVFVGKDLSHTEVGIGSAMLRVHGKLEEGTMRCAKRSSASLRTALQLEAGAEANEKNAKEDKQGPASKMRRDRRTCIDQVGSAVACGDEDLVLVPILGRAVVLFGQSYVLCCFCGVLVNLLPGNRFQGEPCCMRCDGKLSTRDRPDYDHSEAAVEPQHHHCRYCGKRDSLPKTLSKWRTYHAPQDNLGENASVPSPLRRVVYCSGHSKSWVNAAHRSAMTMSEIFAHLSLRIKPCTGASMYERKMLAFKPVLEGAAVTKPSKVRRKRLLRIKSKK